MGAIFRREVTSYFTSPIAYIFLAVFNFFAGMFFFMGNMAGQTTDMTALFSNMFLILMFLIPILTMKLMSEEKKQKTDQILLTAPVNIGSIILGKYFAALVVFVIALCTFLLYGGILSVFTTIEWAVVLGSVFGIFLLGAAFIAVGLFVSALTENQVIAAIGGFVAMMVLYMIDSIAYQISNPELQRLLMRFSFYSRYTEFSSGLFNIASIIFFISVTVIFLFLAVRMLEKRRWA